MTKEDVLNQCFITSVLKFQRKLKLLIRSHWSHSITNESNTGAKAGSQKGLNDCLMASLAINALLCVFNETRNRQEAIHLDLNIDFRENDLISRFSSAVWRCDGQTTGGKSRASAHLKEILNKDRRVKNQLIFGQEAKIRHQPVLVNISWKRN